MHVEGQESRQLDWIWSEEGTLLLTVYIWTPKENNMTQRTPLTGEIKTRVPETVKRGLVEEAARRELDLSDIAREAFREYLARRQSPTEPVTSKA